MPDPYAALRDEIFRTVFDGPGETPPKLRHAAADNVSVPDELRTLVDKIHHHAYTVTDEDLARLKPKYRDDELFEIVVAATVGASRTRLFAGLDALEQA